jgi:hypothetical protein
MSRSRSAIWSTLREWSVTWARDTDLPDSRVKRGHTMIADAPAAWGRTG